MIYGIHLPTLQVPVCGLSTLPVSKSLQQCPPAGGSSRSSVPLQLDQRSVLLPVLDSHRPFPGSFSRAQFLRCPLCPSQCISDDGKGERNSREVETVTFRDSCLLLHIGFVKIQFYRPQATLALSSATLLPGHSRLCFSETLALKQRSLMLGIWITATKSAISKNVHFLGFTVRGQTGEKVH